MQPGNKWPTDWYRSAARGLRTADLLGGRYVLLPQQDTISSHFHSMGLGKPIKECRGKSFLPHYNNWHKYIFFKKLINKQHPKLTVSDSSNKTLFFWIRQDAHTRTHTLWFSKSVGTLLKRRPVHWPEAPPPSTLWVMEKIMVEFQTASKYVHFDPHLCTAWICRSKNRQSWK